ncbi:MAG: hypothetical protein A1D16_00125 [Flavihumibacter sp. CACIAM 22H1]|nr:hypothetical protein [Flavihumibacter sp. CACIAM 22H1]KYP14110.1 MAG: hypothetical protein A1D16_00125 [Flavihumibacter sp. CACIAM 22H1]
MALLIRFILNKGSLHGKELVRKDLVEAMGKQRTTIAAKNGLPNGYALGIASRDRHGVTGIAHSGNIIGYKAMLYIFPEAGKVFFVSYNMDSETANYEVFSERFIDLLAIPTVSPAALVKEQAQAPFSPEKWQGYYVPSITKIQPLQLLDRIGSFTRVKATKNGLLLMPAQKNRIVLFGQANGLFKEAGKIDYAYCFYENNNGEKFLTNGLQTLQQINGWGLLLEISSVIV